MQVQTKTPFIVIGKVLGTHGLKGFFKVELFNGKDSILAPGMEIFLEGPAKDQQAFHLLELSHGPRYALLKIAEASQLEEIEKIISPGMQLSLKRENFPRLQDHEFYECDLLGLAVFESPQAKKAWAKVESIYFNGAQSVLELRCMGDNSLLAHPLVIPDLVQEVDFTHNRVIARPLEWERLDDKKKEGS